ncbi:DUF1499 domain-containing protein [Roseinatronobacter sp. NSM]|uniref:DUF1499 domain-containing protein n=1 Tax=Roseinatronobacter sp. NSM TaxID=3457785 RepID=UPI004036B353
MVKLGLIVLVVLAVAVAAYIRLAPSDPATWHEDPRLVARPKTPNFHLIRMVGGDAMPPIFQMSPAALAAQVDEIARRGGAQLLAGSVAQGHMTYLTRTPVMGFPDYTTVMIEPAGDGAALLAFARARFGHSDMGNNRARLQAWIAALQALPVRD